jgi:hypothetical protein
MLCLETIPFVSIREAIDTDTLCIRITPLGWLPAGFVIYNKIVKDSNVLYK